MTDTEDRLRRTMEGIIQKFQSAPPHEGHPLAAQRLDRGDSFNPRPRVVFTQSTKITYIMAACERVRP